MDNKQLITKKENSEYLNNELLRLSTAGSVDDGKSTLIGRLLYDSKAIFEDQLNAIENVSKINGEKTINLAYFTDGLRAEREQGITIDVAYRYFSTPKRKFIIADTPGHFEYTRNMVTGASTANVALILVDARNGVTEQTVRHAFIASLLQIPHVIICVNKIDLIDYSNEIFENICTQFRNFAAKLDVQDVSFIPISAKFGDNVVNRSKNTNWYEGPTLIYLLENIHISSDYNHIDARFPIQYVIHTNSDTFNEYRSYAGRIASGIFEPGDIIQVLPSGFKSAIKTINFYDKHLDIAVAPQSVALTLKDDIDISRGDMIVKENNVPNIGQDIDMMICWLNEKPMELNKKYTLLHTTNEVKCIIKDVKYKINIITRDKNTNDLSIGQNEIGRISIRTTKPIFYDSYRKNRITGSIILIDVLTNETICAGMII